MPGGRVDERRELRGREAREVEQEVAEVALRVDREDRDSALEELLDQDDAERGLAAARHPDDEAVRRQVGGVEAEVLRAGLPRAGIDGAAEEEAGFHLGHARDLSAAGIIAPWTRTPHEPAPSAVPMLPRDTNGHGTIFGGVLLAYIDQAGAIATRPTATSSSP